MHFTIKAHRARGDISITLFCLLIQARPHSPRFARSYRGGARALAHRGGCDARAVHHVHSSTAQFNMNDK